MKSGIGSHTKPNRGKNDVWLTPPNIIAALGSFALDPCACPEPRPFSTAAANIQLPNDGLAAQWKGRVWCNPPYGPETASWLSRMAQHGRGTALVFARTETDAWTKFVWPFASAVKFIKGRIHFYLPDGTRAKGNAGGPSALVAYGYEDAQILKTCGVEGFYVDCARERIVATTRRVCGICQKPIRRHDKWTTVGSVIQHKDCSNPTLSTNAPQPQQNLLEDQP